MKGAVVCDGACTQHGAVKIASMAASSITYLSRVVSELSKQWPDNRTVCIACHGHSVPAGYFASSIVDTFNAYPHLLHRRLKERFPLAVVNIVTTAKGGESSDEGAARFENEVLNHRPDVVTLDYALNDRRIGLYSSEAAHRTMIEKARESGAKVILVGPNPDKRVIYDRDDKRKLEAHNALLQSLADEYEIGWANIYPLFPSDDPERLDALLSWVNHPNARGHALIADELMKWFPIPGLRPSRIDAPEESGEESADSSENSGAPRNGTDLSKEPVAS